MVDDLYVAPQRCTIDPVALITAFAVAHVELTDSPVDTEAARRMVEMVAAQARHEMADDATTPADDDVAYNFNLTGLKREHGYAWTTLGTHEVISDERADQLIREGLAEPERHPHKAPAGRRAVYFKNLGPEKSHAATHFRAFPSLDDAAWWSLRKYLVMGSRYAVPSVQAALLDADTAAFAKALKRLGYYTAEESEYARALSAQLVRVRRDAERVDWAGLPLMSKRRARELGALVGMTVQGREVALWRMSERGGCWTETFGKSSSDTALTARA